MGCFVLTKLFITIVDFSRRAAWLMIAFGLGLVVASGWYAATHFALNTDINQIISQDLEWRKQEKILSDAFPQKQDQLVIVIDAQTTANAEDAAVRLTEKLQSTTGIFRSIVRPDAIPFFRTHGFMLLPKSELADTLDHLTEAQPLIGTITSDPSLRGLAGMIGLMTQGFMAGQTDYARLDKPLSAFAATIDAATDGKDAPLALDQLASDSDRKPTLRDTRKFILTQPALNFAALSPGEAASDTVRQAARDLNLTPDHGVTVRLTGPVALNDEEFASVSQGAGIATALSGILVFVQLLMALRSFRIVLPILFTLIVGLAATTAFALAAIGSLNLISVAFAVMFIGIAVDFGIQFGVRYRDQHHHFPDHTKALQRTAQVIAVPLSMAAGSTALGFLTFIPTDYRGVSELGLIAGGGMVIAFLLNITLLPALLTLTRPPAEPEQIGFGWAAPLDAFLIKNRKAMLGFALILGIIGIGITTQLRFDFDPLNLKNPQTESVATLFDIMADPDASPYTIEILRPNLAEADALAAQIAALPVVDHAMTLSSFVPDDQAMKRSLIDDTWQILAPTFGLPQLASATDKDITDSLSKIVAPLHSIGARHESAEHLAKAFDKILQNPDPAILQRVQRNLVTGMQKQIETIRDLLTAPPITLDQITDDLRRDWITADGRALIEVYPKGNARDHTVLMGFTKAVRDLAPDATGAPITIQESGHTVTTAFIQAGVYAVLAIALLALITLRRITDVLRMLAPLILAGILTLATLVLIGLPLNFANIIALPLLLSLGVSYAIYFVSYWRAGHSNPLQSSMARAVLFSAGTVFVAFGSLALSAHTGTAGMGKLLTISLVYSLICTFVFLPCLLGSTKIDRP
jgi:hypothetical protein